MVTDIITLEEAKNYLRVDMDEDNELIETLTDSAVTICSNVARCCPIDLEVELGDTTKTAVLYTLGYLYEHRENADYHELTITLRSLLFSSREGVF